jgi:glycosyltransferase involved in cell wall biosynthesis
MNICFLLNDAYGIGGIERVARIVADGLSSSHRIFVQSLFLRKEGSLSPAWQTKITCQYENRTSLKKIFIGSAKKLRAFNREQKVDLVISVGEAMAPIAALAVFQTGVQHICWTHNNIGVNQEYSFQRLCRYLAVKSSDFVVTLTDHSREQFARTYRTNHLCTIPNPVDEHLIKDFSYCLESKKLITVGRFCRAKNYSLLVEVAELVLPQNPDWTWDIYGDGDLFLDIQKELSRKNLLGRVRLMGAVDNLYELYPDYSIQVMTSSYEGFPMVLLEGMASGLPLVAFDIETGPSEIIQEGENGFLVQPFDKETMAKRILYLMRHPTVRLKMSDKNRLLRYRYSQEKILESWNSLLERISER